MKLNISWINNKSTPSLIVGRQSSSSYEALTSKLAEAYCFGEQSLPSPKAMADNGGLVRRSPITKNPPQHKAMAGEGGEYRINFVDPGTGPNKEK